MIDPKTLSLDSLPWMPLTANLGLPAQPGIYFAIDSLGQVQYIGRSVDIRNRWKNHHRHNRLIALGEIKIAYLLIDDTSLLDPIEFALIERFDPPLNAIRVKPRPAQSNLSRQTSTKNTNKKRISLYLSPELKDSLEKLAKLHSRSVNNLIEVSIKQEIKTAKESGEISA